MRRQHGFELREFFVPDGKIGTAGAPIKLGHAIIYVAQGAAGGDFADGVIAHEGEWLGAEVFVSFDRRAIRRLEAQGRAAMMADEAKGRA